MKIHIASDHAGFEMKNFLKNELVTQGYDVIDYGPKSLDINDDYPDFILPCAQAIGADDTSFGVILGGSGEGEQIIANKVDGVRAIEYYGKNPEIIKLGREHNNANILSLGARFLNNDEALNAVKLFIETNFTNEDRHTRRVEKIKDYETKN
jgi:ribose 5-phosphate isomerase B